jgi:hypothetical protein
MAEPEPKEALSLRKLVAETAKFNVLTSHSPHEAVTLLEMFPRIDAIVLVAEIGECEKIVEDAKQIRPDAPIILLSANQTAQCDGIEHHLSSHEPEELVNLLRSMFGDPRNG